VSVVNEASKSIDSLEKFIQEHSKPSSNNKPRRAKTFHEKKIESRKFPQRSSTVQIVETNNKESPKIDSVKPSVLE
jgi:hypothetical protein